MNKIYTGERMKVQANISLTTDWILISLQFLKQIIFLAL